MSAKFILTVSLSAVVLVISTLENLNYPNAFPESIVNTIALLLLISSLPHFGKVTSVVNFSYTVTLTDSKES